MERGIAPRRVCRKFPFGRVIGNRLSVCLSITVICPSARQSICLSFSQYSSFCLSSSVSVSMSELINYNYSYNNTVHCILTNPQLRLTKNETRFSRHHMQGSFCSFDSRKIVFNLILYVEKKPVIHPHATKTTKCTDCQ